MYRVTGFFLVSAAALVLTSFDASAQTPPPLPKAKAAAPGAAGTVQAQPAGPDMTTETYGDWILRCSKANDARRCEVSQTLVMQGQSAPIALIAFGREKKGDPLRMVVQLPNNVTLEGGVKAVLASGDTAVELRFRRCLNVGCFADAVLTDPLTVRLRNQSEPLSIKFRDGTEREITLPFSPKGLGPALDALARVN
jgi:invasion protein IalB